MQLHNPDVCFMQTTVEQLCIHEWMIKMVVHVHNFTVNDTLLLLQVLVVNSLWNHICLYCPNAAHPSGMVACFIQSVSCSGKCKVWHSPKFHSNSLILYHLGECCSSGICVAKSV